MTTNFWRNLVAALINELTTGSFSQFKSLFQQLFDKVVKDRKDPPILVVGNKRKDAFMAVGDAPDDVKKSLKDLILDLVSQAFNGRPILLKIVTAFLNTSVLDGLIDKLWDSIFAAKIAAGEIAPFAAFPVKDVKVTKKVKDEPTVLTCSSEDLKECCAELGLIDQLGKFNANAPASEAPVLHSKSLSPEEAGAHKTPDRHSKK